MSEQEIENPVPSLQSLLDARAPMYTLNGNVTLKSDDGELSVGSLFTLTGEEQASISVHDRIRVSYNFCKETALGAMVGGTIKIGDSSVVSSEALSTTQRDALVEALTAIHNAASSIDTSMGTIRQIASDAIQTLHT